MKRGTAILYLAAAVLAWGIEYPFMRTATRAVGSLATGAVMFTLSAVLVGTHLALTGRLRPLLRAPRRTWQHLLGIGCIGLTANVLGLWAIQRAPIANVSALVRTDALFSLGLSAFVFGEAVPRRAWLFVPLMLVGVGLLTGLFTGPLQVGNPGNYAALGCAAAVARNAYVIKPAARTVGGPAVGFVNASVIGVGSLVATCAAAWRAGRPVGLGAAYARTDTLALAGIAYVFFIGYNTALASLPVWAVRVAFLLTPVVATFAGWLWLGETVPALARIGIGCICGGAVGVIAARHLPALRRVPPHDA